jgi:hypothetical protein
VGQDDRVNGQSRPRAPGDSSPHHSPSVARSSQGWHRPSLAAADGQAVSLIHVRIPASITSSCAGSIYQHGQSWTVIPHPEKQKVGAASRGAVGPASAAGLTLAARPPHNGPSRQAHVGSAQKCVDLANAVANNEPGRARTTLERPSRRVACQRTVGRRRPDLDKPDLATDQMLLMVDDGPLQSGPS